MCVLIFVLSQNQMRTIQCEIKLVKIGLDTTLGICKLQLDASIVAFSLLQIQYQLNVYILILSVFLPFCSTNGNAPLNQTRSQSMFCNQMMAGADKTITANWIQLQYLPFYNLLDRKNYWKHPSMNLSVSRMKIATLVETHFSNVNGQCAFFFANQKHHTHIQFDTLFGCSHFYLIIFKKKNTFSNLNAFFTCILMTIILHLLFNFSLMSIRYNIYVYCSRILLTISAFSVSFISFAHFIFVKFCLFFLLSTKFT